MNKEKDNKGNIILYSTEDNKIRIELKVSNQTVWLNQKEISELFQKADSTIKEHIKNIYEDGECDINSTSRKFRLVQKIDKKIAANKSFSAKSN